jgi:endonuclease/exonuclease/phosphatase (EEP) superfamily protein YafD
MKPRAATTACQKWSSYLRRLSWFGTAALALPTLAGLLAGWWWVFELTCHFRVQYAVGCGCLFVAALIIRCWKPAIAAAALLIVNLCLIVPLYYPPVPADNRPAQLRLMTLNVHSANRHYERVRDLIRKESPDVVCVLEFSEDWQDALAQIQAEYSFTKLAPLSLIHI